MATRGTRLQITLKPEQMEKLEALMQGSYLTQSQFFMMLIDQESERRTTED